MPRETKQDILIEGKDPDFVFNALISPSWIKKWWLAATAIVIPKEEGIICCFLGHQRR